MNGENRPVIIETDMVHAMCIISAIQLATRHPKWLGPTRQLMEAFARSLQEKIAPELPETTNAILEMGWNPDMDL